MPAWTIPYSKSGVFPMPAFTKSTSFQTLETFQTMYITKQIPSVFSQKAVTRFFSQMELYSRHGLEVSHASNPKLKKKIPIIKGA